VDNRVRELLFEPLRKYILSAIVPDFIFTSGDQEISAPAQLVRCDDEFQFTLHFNTGQPPPQLQSLRGGFFNEADRRTVSGQINGEIGFRCDDVFPPSTMTTRSRGTSITVLNSNRMHLVAEGTDAMRTNEVRRVIGQPAEDDSGNRRPFSAHLIYHGPKLKMRDAGTEVITKNDFLGEAASSTADTHQFQSGIWEGALIQQELELHLHLRSREGATVDLSSQQIIDLVDHANQSVGFVLGFQPWPAYREIRIDHQVIERWLSPRFDLSTIYLVPASEAMWSHCRDDHSNAIHQIIPTIADGLGRLPKEDSKKLTTLLWHFRSGNDRGLPSSTRLLILCAVLDGLTKLIAGARSPKKAATRKMWKRASAKLGFSWDRWTKDVFEVWGKHRHLLAHGWLWLGEEIDAKEFFTDHSQLGCAFLTFVAAYCGYEGPIIANPFENRIITVRDIKD
jgi:hypothetical protein